jgi:hypothetical protein
MLTNRSVVFFAQDGCLVRIVAGGDDRTYSHRCSKAVFEAVAHAIAETPAEGAGTSLHQIARQEGIAYTQANVALEFLKERGLVDVRHRRSYPATADTYLDAMIEFHVLAHENKMV